MTVTESAESAGLSIAMEPDPSGLIRVRLLGKLDGSGAYQLRDRLLALSGEPVVVDFSRLSESSDFALAILAMWLTENGGSGIRLVGMRTHASRILRAFGVSAAA